MRKITAFFLAFALFLTLFSCSASERSSDYFSFYDALGNEVRLDEQPKRVAVLFSSFADMWLLAGGEIAITVGESVERGFASANTPLVDAGAGKHVSTELLFSYEPDFVIYSADIAVQVDAAKILRGAGIASAGFKVENFSDYLSVLDIMTSITERKDRYSEYGTQISEKIALLLSSAEQKSRRRYFL
jgi:iron complex transport system substrate-binding protein